MLKLVGIFTQSHLDQFQGKSEPFLLRAYTLKSAERQVDPEAARDPTKRSEHRVIPVLWIVFGISGLLTIIAIVILIVIRPRCSPGSNRNRAGSVDERSRKNPSNKNGLKIDLVIGKLFQQIILFQTISYYECNYLIHILNTVKPYL